MSKRVYGKLLLEGTNSCDEFEWEDTCDCITEAMKEINKKNSGYWTASMLNFGWRGVSGSKNFKAKNGEELLRAILPNTDCSFKIYTTKKQIKIDNAHHDKPCGGEWYVITPAKEEEEEF